MEEISFSRPVIIYSPHLKVENGSAFGQSISIHPIVQILQITEGEHAARRPIYSWRNFRSHYAGFSNLLMEENHPSFAE
jgi:hypothetical protein